MDNITMISHMAGTSCDTMACSVEIGHDDIKLFLEGKPMRNVRNPRVTWKTGPIPADSGGICGLKTEDRLSVRLSRFFYLPKGNIWGIL